MVQKEADWNLLQLEVRAERVSFTQWDVRVQELNYAEQARVTAAREAAADALDTGITEHMRVHFCISCLESRSHIPLQLGTAVQTFADGPNKVDVNQVIRINVANLSAGDSVTSHAGPQSPWSPGCRCIVCVANFASGHGSVALSASLRLAANDQGRLQSPPSHFRRPDRAAQHSRLGGRHEAWWQRECSLPEGRGIGRA